jgi:hypothetical protein
MLPNQPDPMPPDPTTRGRATQLRPREQVARKGQPFSPYNDATMPTLNNRHKDEDNDAHYMPMLYREVGEQPPFAQCRHDRHSVALTRHALM